MVWIAGWRLEEPTSKAEALGGIVCSVAVSGNDIGNFQKAVCYNGSCAKQCGIFFSPSILRVVRGGVSFPSEHPPRLEFFYEYLKGALHHALKLPSSLHTALRKLQTKA